MSPETEERISRQLTTFEELVKHLATKEELQKLRVETILWTIGTNIAIGAAIVSALVWHFNSQFQQINARFDQLMFFLQHWTH
jgi:hypothetical protein